MKKWNVLILSALVMCATWRPVSAAEAPLVLGMLEIRGLDTLAASAFELSKAAGSPMPKEMISMGLYSALGTMPGLGISPEGTVRVVAFDNGTDKGGWAILLPVENAGADYLSGLGQNGWKNESETADGLLHYVAPDDSGAAWKDWYFLKRGATLVAAQTADDARKADAATPFLPPILQVEGDMAIQIRLAALAETFAPQIAEQMDKAFKSPGLPANSAAMGDLYAKTYLAAARQVDEFVLGLGVADGHLNVHTRIAPADGTALARWLKTVQPPSASAAIVALPEALAVETMNLGDPGVLAPAYFRFFEKLMDIMPTGLDAAVLARYLENEKTCYAQLAGDFGIALLPPTKEAPLRLAEYVALKDPSAIRAILPEMVRTATDMMAGALAEESQPMPFHFAIDLGEPREYREIAIDRLTYSFDFSGPMAGIWPAAIPTKFSAEVAWLPGGALACLGDAALTDALVDRALDGGAAPLTSRPAWQTLFPEPEANLVDVAHVALFDALRSYLALGDSIRGGTQAEQIPASSGNLESASYVFGGIMTRIRFSLADIAAVGEKVKALNTQRAYGNPPMPMPEEAPAAVEAAEEAGGNRTPGAEAVPPPEPVGAGASEEAEGQE